MIAAAVARWDQDEGLDGVKPLSAGAVSCLLLRSCLWQIQGTDFVAHVHPPPTACVALFTGEFSPCSPTCAEPGLLSVHS